MSRVVRRVPENWEHPKDEKGGYIPLLNGFNAALAEWDEGAAKWAQGLVRRSLPNRADDWEPKPPEASECQSYAEWSGDRPEPQDYMPDWPEAERTHLQMYETTSEGTPISPVMETAEELAQWLADNKASAFAGETATYDEWLSTIKRGWAVSAVGTFGEGLTSGVRALHE